MTASDITAISAAVVALASLVVSAWTTLLARRHNRLSVTPHLRIDCDHRPGERVQLVLSNSGIGPAVVRGMRASVDGQFVESSEAAGLTEALPRVGLSGEFYTFTLFAGDALAPGEEKILLEFALDGNDAEVGARLQAALRRVGLEVVYESMYGDRFVLGKLLSGEPAKHITR